jgi:molybdopterin-guanine dinucleotide biosynthesis protein A
MVTPLDYDAVVLAGGAARRFDGVDKTRLPVAGTPMLDRVLRACAAAATTVVVGPERPTYRPVTWAREDPPGGGPVPAIAAGLARCAAGLVVLLAADLPFVTPPVVDELLAAVGDHDGAFLVDATGHTQPLTAAYRTAPLAAAIGAGGPGAPLLRTLAPLDVVRVTDTTGAAVDCDTPDELRAARRRADEDEHHG